MQIKRASLKNLGGRGTLLLSPPILAVVSLILLSGSMELISLSKSKMDQNRPVKESSPTMNTPFIKRGEVQLALLKQKKMWRN